MLRYFSFFTASFLLLCLNAQAQQQPTTAETVLQSILHNHPKLLELEAKGGQRRQELAYAEAAFDVQLEQDTALRTSGYYSGDYLSQRVVNPLGTANAKVKAEYRIGNGTFPYYERYYETLTGGEASIGFAMSLLQNRETDKKRMAIEDARVSMSQWDAEAALALNELVYNGLSAYLDWYESHLNEQIYAALVKTTETRGNAINTRVEEGDLARITQTEFEVTVMQRNLALQDARRKAAQAREKLAYYYRDAQFRPVSTATLNTVPGDIQWPWMSAAVKPALLQSLIAQHPALTSLQAEMQLAKNKLRLAKNALLPTLDVEAKLARDIGSGPENLTGTETKVGLQFSMPLGRRQAKADEAKASLKLREIEAVVQTTQDALERDMAVGLQALQYGKTMAELQQQQAVLTEKLFSQEQKRFEMGDSDLFLLNSRESQAISARLNAVKAEIEIKRIVLGIYYQTGLLAQTPDTSL
ncbi:TolC family protein [Alteromonas sp. NFXS44]|uniref:TolC family protein n=1 Tax=Alteromonas sp. NFXS44 TaxID=2818435 RepID=UPI0032DFEF7C